MLESVQKASSMWRWAIAAAIISSIHLTVPSDTVCTAVVYLLNLPLNVNRMSISFRSRFNPRSIDTHSPKRSTATTSFASTILSLPIACGL